MKHNRNKAPTNPRARELIAKARSGTETAESAQALLRMQSRGRQTAARKRSTIPGKKEAPKPQSPTAAEKIAALHRKEYVEQQIAERYQVDDRHEIYDEETQELIPNPHYGKRIDQF